MRPLCLASVLLVSAGCTVRVPAPPALHISVKARAAVKVQGTAGVEAPPVPVTPPPPPQPVEIQGAAVVEFFGIPLEDAQDVVFVLDRSGSMSNPARGRMAEAMPASPAPAEPAPVDPAAAPPPVDPAAAPPPATPAPAPRKIDVAHAELADALRRMPAGTRLNVLFFNDTLDAFAPGLFPLEDGGRDGLIAYVMEAAPDGMTALAPAMRTAFMMNARRIVLLSDGLGNVGGDARALLRDAREAMLGGVRIDTIGIGSGQDGHLLGTLARESGGIYQAL